MKPSFIARVNSLHHFAKLGVQFLAALAISSVSAMATAQTCPAGLAKDQPTADYDLTQNGGATVTHAETGLTWMRCSAGQSWNGTTCTGAAIAQTWQASLQSAKNETAFGGGWRLPNIQELKSIVEAGCYSPAINGTVFPATITSYYWSSSSYAGNPAGAWAVYFSGGYDGNNGKTVSYYVRLVRGGQLFGDFDGGGVGAGQTVAVTGIAVSSGEAPAVSTTAPTTLAAPLQVVRGQRVAIRLQAKLLNGSVVVPTSVTLSSTAVAGGNAWVARELSSNPAQLMHVPLAGPAYRVSTVAGTQDQLLEFHISTAAPLDTTVSPSVVVTFSDGTVVNQLVHIRVVPPEYGVTVVSHGFQFPSQCEPLYDIATAVLVRAGRGRIYQYDHDTASMTDITTVRLNDFATRAIITAAERAAVTAANLGAGEQIVVPRWCTSSNNAAPGFNEAVAHSLYVTLKTWDERSANFEAPLSAATSAPRGLLRDGNTRKYHLIGHSFGTAMLNQLARRMVTIESIKNIEFTTLDPHDFDQPNLAVDGPARLMNIDTTRASIAGIQTLRNFYQRKTPTDLAIPAGRCIVGAQNRRLDVVFANNYTLLATGAYHTDVHVWYLTSILPDRPNVFENTINDVTNTWFTPASSTAFSGRMQAAYQSSRLAGAWASPALLDSACALGGVGPEDLVAEQLTDVEVMNRTASESARGALDANGYLLQADGLFDSQFKSELNAIASGQLRAGWGAYARASNVAGGIVLHEGRGVNQATARSDLFFIKGSAKSVRFNLQQNSSIISAAGLYQFRLMLLNPNTGGAWLDHPVSVGNLALQAQNALCVNLTGLNPAGQPSLMNVVSPFDVGLKLVFGNVSFSDQLCAAPVSTVAGPNATTRAFQSTSIVANAAAPECGITSHAYTGAPTAGTGIGQTNPPTDSYFSYGMTEFGLEKCAATVQISITFPNPVPAGAQYWKYGPTTSSKPVKIWYTVPYTLSTDRKTLTITITDGQTGDDDLTVNGKISDPGGLAIPLDPAGNTVPDAFTFDARTGVAAAVPLVSSIVTVLGTTNKSAISVVNGEYSIGCTDVFTAVPGTILPFQFVCVRQLTAATVSTNKVTTLSIGGVSAAFTTTTAAQSIAVVAPTSKTFGDTPFAISATSTNGIAVGFASLTQAVCTVSGASVTIVAAGDCVIRASQPAGGTAAPPADVTIMVAKAAQTVAFAAIADARLGANVTASATATSGLVVGFSSATPGVCAVVGNAISLIGAGACSISASQLGNANYLAAASVSRSFQVSAAEAPLRLTASTALAAVGSAMTVTASVGGTGTVTFTLASGEEIPGCANVRVVSRSATCVVPSRFVARSPLAFVAAYSGDAANPAASVYMPQAVRTDAATLSTSVSPVNPIVAGSRITITALVRMNNPAGTVSFLPQNFTTEPGASAPTAIAGCDARPLTMLAGASDAAIATCSMVAPAGSTQVIARFNYPSGSSSGLVFEQETQPLTVLASAPANYSDMWWAGARENGWGVSITQHGATQFNVIFAYDDAGKPIWYAMSGCTWAGNACTGSLYQPTGAPFLDYDASKFNANAAVGSVTFTYKTASTATMSYTINGKTGTKEIERQVFATATSAPTLGVNDLWWSGMGENGWGINITQQGRQLFPVWYTYGADGKTTFFAVPGGTWSGLVFTGDIYTTTSSAWLGAPYDTTKFVATKVGTMIIDYSSASSAAVTYTIGNVTQTKQITRQDF